MKRERLMVLLACILCLSTAIFQSIHISGDAFKSVNVPFDFNDMSALDEELVDMCIYALKSDDLETVYFGICKLVEAFNCPDFKDMAIQSLTSLLNHDDGNIRSNALFVLAILDNRFSDIVSPFFLEVGRDDFVFSLPGMFPDYGAQNRLYRIHNNQLELFSTFDVPHKYIHSMQVSPEGDFLLVETVSRKSSYLHLIDLEYDTISSEIMDTARIKYAEKNGIPYMQRMDYENYSQILQMHWVDDFLLHIEAELAFDGRQTSGLTFLCDILYNTSTEEIRVAN